jgi:hypothetical protein
MIFIHKKSPPIGGLFCSAGSRPEAICLPEYFSGRLLRQRTLPLNDWQTILDGSSLAVDAGCTLAHSPALKRVAMRCSG